MEPYQAHEMLDDVNRLRARVRRHRRQHPLWGTLTGAVAAIGSATFYFTDQIETSSCEEMDWGTVCSGSLRSFNGGWIWLLAATVAVALPFLRRYRRGTWQPSTAAWIGIGIIALIVLPVLVPLVSVLDPIVYPLGAAFAVVALAIRRRDAAITAAAVLLVGAMLHANLRVRLPWLHESNLGLALSSLAVAVLAFGAAALWAQQERRA
jgi:hypothetical protein